MQIANHDSKFVPYTDIFSLWTVGDVLNSLHEIVHVITTRDYPR